jgi:hypothetical protein
MEKSIRIFNCAASREKQDDWHIGKAPKTGMSQKKKVLPEQVGNS